MHYFKRALVSAFALMLMVFTFNTALGQDGKALFQTNCAQCHAVNGVVIGPALKDIEKRRPEAWLIKWVKNSQAMVKSGDQYAVDIFNKYNKTVMTNFSLKDEEIRSIFAYVKEEASKAPATAVAKGGEGADGKSEDSTNWNLILTIAVVVIGGLALILSKAAKTLDNVLREKQGLEPIADKEYSWSATKTWMGKNKKIVALAILFLIVFGSIKGWYMLADIGISQNYQPDQPIAFSHKVHAGENGIACVYCHFGAEKGKTAGIPSANVCMNCHKYIKQGANTGTEEIAKIYKALDWNPETQQYGSNQKPIKWVRVHNLPDFAYFNHSQHVMVGQVKCQTCHGPVEEMTVAKQFSPLTMSWCIDCHRTTEVKMEGNHYYDDLHKKLADKYGKDAKLTVEKIGGLECARCHY